MGAIEVMWGVLIVAFGLIGIVRGFLKELGVTTVLLVMLFAFDHWGAKATGYLSQGVSQLGLSSLHEPDRSAFQAAFYIITTVIVTFISYQGETLAFGGTAPKGGTGILLALVIGVVNGYLIAGTMWFYLDQFGYPFLLVSRDLTPLAQRLIKILPQAILSPFLPFLMVFMVAARVIR